MQAGEYYICHTKDKPIKVGDIGLVTDVDEEGQIHLTTERGNYWYKNEGDFLNHFRFDPEGEAKMNALVKEWMSPPEVPQELAAISVDVQAMLPGAVQATPEVEAEAESTAMVPMGKSAPQHKAGFAKAKQAVQRLEHSMAERREKLELVLKAQMDVMRSRLEKMQALTRTLGEAIWTLDIYMGHGEDVVQIATGEPCAPETPITVRQLTLYMDEESVIGAEKGGMDFQELEVFDDWLLASPENLRQVLPEEKGIVALKPRRNRKDYKADRLTDTFLNAQNKKTYFLIRNGGNLYRVCSQLEVGDTMVPKRDEFDKLFVDPWNRDEDGAPKILRPGSPSYVRAMKSAEGLRRHYLRVLLLMQGILDRTTIFHPLPTERVNLCDPRTCGEIVNFAYDAEMALTDGRPTFFQWLAEINASLDVGSRVAFQCSSYASEREEDFEIRPRTAYPPKSRKIHVIDGREKDRFRVLYQREGEMVYTYWESHAPKRRAAITFTAENRAVVHIDAVTVADIDYYMSSRQSRHAYLHLVPLLKVARDVIVKEEAEEAPFRELLAGQIVSKYDVTIAEAQKSVDELVRWWKFKNRTHRALTSDDAKALRMIVAEYGHRNKRTKEVEEQSGEFAEILNALHETEPTAVCIAHKTQREFVVCVPANDENIFYHEHTYQWLVRTKEAKRTKVSEWKLVDSRFQRWHVLWQADRWADWIVNGHRSQYYTDPEREQLCKQVLDMMRRQDEQVKERTHAAFDGSTCSRELPFAIVVCHEEKQDEIRVWYVSREGQWDMEHPLTKRSEGVKVERHTINVTRTKYGFQTSFTWSCTGPRIGLYEKLLEARKAGQSYYRLDTQWGVDDGRILWFDDSVVEWMAKRDAEYAEFEAVHDAMNSKCRFICDQIETEARRRAEEKVHAEYLEAGNAPEFWEKTRKSSNKIGASIRDAIPSHKLAHRAVERLLEAGVDLEGMTVKDILEQGLPRDEKDETKFALSYDESDDDIELHPMDFTVTFEGLKTVA
jgi:hypothetical protein